MAPPSRRSSRRRRTRFSSAAASARSPISKLAGQGPRPRHPGHHCRARSRSRHRGLQEVSRQIAVGIDAKGGKVAVEGWAEASELGVIELAKKFEGAGVAAIIYTDIDRDGILTGINWDSTIELAEAVSIPVIASGGLASIADIVRMTMPDAEKLEGAISGRALYDGRIDPAEALAVLRGEGREK
jgi:phosphoribosylformimino-5-aminoimidazole carboxamide ribonucleotide (ProFAR) isomerase